MSAKSPFGSSARLTAFQTRTNRANPCAIERCAPYGVKHSRKMCAIVLALLAQQSRTRGSNEQTERPIHLDEKRGTFPRQTREESTSTTPRKHPFSIHQENSNGSRFRSDD